MYRGESIIVLGGVPFESKANQTSLQMTRELAKTLDVWYLCRSTQRPRRDPRGLLRTAVSFRNWRSTYCRIDRNLHVVTLPRLFDFVPLAFPAWWRKVVSIYLLHVVRAMIRKYDIVNPGLLAYWWFFPEIVSLETWRFRIFDVIDRHWDPSANRRDDRRGQQHLKYVLRTADAADATFVVSPALRDELETFGVFTYCAENGVDLERIASIDLGGHRTRVAVYAGGINKRIDFDLLNNTVESNPDWLFIVAGGGPRLCEIGDAPNLHKLGNVDYEDVLRILKASAVGIIPFRESEYVTSSSLIKLVDYLACGVKVVVTPAVPLGRMADAAGEQIFVVERSAWSDAFQGLGSVVSNEELDLSSFSVQARSSRMLGIVAEVSP